MGLCISPEDDDYPDRMRIDGRWPDRGEFVRLYERLKPALDRRAEALPPGRYLSPFGIFLLMALLHFRDRRVAHFVIETGRGAKHDEAGRIPAKVGVVTAILPEHLAYIGPTLADIAANKLALGEVTEQLVIGPTTIPWARELDAAGQEVTVPPPDPTAPAPGWVAVNRAIAGRALRAYLGCGVPVPVDLGPDQGAFGTGTLAGADGDAVQVTYESLIQAGSLDTGFLDRLIGETGDRLAVILSLPDDKDIDGVLAIFRARGIDPWHVAVQRPRGDIRFERTKAELGGRLIADLFNEDVAGAADVFRRLIAEQRPAHILCLGTHSFTRLVRGALRAASVVGSPAR